jgi:OOP family OmpA-OmpF porin
MSHRRRAVYGSAAALLSVSLLPLTASASEGWYAGVNVGGNFVDSETFSYNSNIPNSGGSADVGYNDDIAWGLNAGYRLPSGFRPEFAIEFRSNDIDSISNSGNSTQNVSGHVDATTFMANVWYDFAMPRREWRRLHPHIGAGLGFADLGVHNAVFSNAQNAGSIDDSQTVFAYQFGLGLGYDIAPNWTLSADFRYLATESGDFHISTATPQISGTASGGYSAESILVGLRYDFGRHVFR